jgi:hypothetical protein
MRDNKEFQKLLNKTHLAHEKYAALLREAEKAYFDRYGHDSSNNNIFVDSFCIGGKNTTVKELDDSVYNMPDNMPKYD